MTLTDVVILLIILLIVGAAVGYIIRAKKRGVKCIGCPSGGSCSGNCNGNCGEH